MSKIILDDKSFKALSAKSRVNILKKLNERRMTLSELSKKLSLKNPTIKEHCNLLLNAELINKIDEGRKWKYYELTNKGKQILTPHTEQLKVLVSLSITFIIFLGLFFIFANNLINQNQIMFSQNLENQPLMKTSSIEKMGDYEAKNLVNTNENTNHIIDYNLLGLIISSIGIGLFIGFFGKDFIRIIKN